MSKSLIIYSSKEFEMTIFVSCNPASSNNLRAFFDKYAASPLSIRIAPGLYPFGIKTSLKTLMALGTPDFNVLYVSTIKLL